MTLAVERDIKQQINLKSKESMAIFSEIIYVFIESLLEL